MRRWEAGLPASCGRRMRRLVGICSVLLLLPRCRRRGRGLMRRLGMRCRRWLIAERWLFLFCSDLPFLNSFVFSFFDQPFAGGSPAATHFLCLAKESKQRKATAGSSPFGVPSDAKQKIGRENNSLRSDIFPLSFHFSHRITGWLQAERPDWLASPRQGGDSPSASWLQAPTMLKISFPRLHFVVPANAGTQ